jgi:hypothetical protein
MIYYIKLTTHNKSYCVETKLTKDSVADSITNLNKADHLYSWVYIKSYLIHGDTSDLLLTQLGCLLPATEYKCELVPSSCFTKMFGPTYWPNYKNWPE